MTDASPDASRRIAHVDMDAFYASVELLRRPDLKDRPVAIGGRGNPDSRGVVTTATYAARKFGIRSGMPLRKAAQLCRDCVFLPVDFDSYRTYSRRFKAALAQIEPRMEDRGIDEVYLDLSARTEDSVTIGRAMKQAILEATALTCSVGIAPNKLLAKISSDLDKPDGLTLITYDDLQSRIWPLPADRINGIGPKASARLTTLGIDSIGAVAAAPPALLQKHFGPTYSRWLIKVANGHRRPAGRHRERTQVEESRDDVRAGPASAARRRRNPRPGARHGGAGRCDLTRGGYVARTIGLKMRYDDFTRVTRDLSLSRRTALPPISSRRRWSASGGWRCGGAIRLLGVKASSLERGDPDGLGSPRRSCSRGARACRSYLDQTHRHPAAGRPASRPVPIRAARRR